VGSTVSNSSATAKFSHEFTSYIKRNKYLIGKDRVHLVYQNISSVRIDRKLIDADIIISGRGAVEITAKDFSISDAKKIEQLINQLL
jgi:hypothetical protein